MGRTGRESERGGERRGELGGKGKGGCGCVCVFMSLWGSGCGWVFVSGNWR